MTQLILLLRDRRYKQEIFTRLGVKGPTPSLIMGNLSEIEQKVRILFSNTLLAVFHDFH